MAPAAKGVSLNHVSRESPDIILRLAQFYIDIFGYEPEENPEIEFGVIWLKLAPSFYLHLIERDPTTKLTEGPRFVADPKNLPRGHHICFSISNFDSFVQILKEKGIQVHHRTQPDGKTRQSFFFDPDGEFPSLANGLYAV